MKRFAVLLLALAITVCCALPAFAAGTIEVTEDVSVSDDYDWTRFKGQNVAINVYNWGEYISNGSDDSVDVVSAFEQLTGVHAVRPDIAGCMGAYGAALLARDRAGADGTSTILSAEDIAHLTVTQKHVRCGRCSNNCQLTVNDFGGGRRFITGNRCEKGAGHKKQKTEAPNLFKKKNELLFKREVLSPDEAPRGTVGIPRALNMCEDYPFWHAFFTRLGFRV